jgi:hypothetical protein
MRLCHPVLALVLFVTAFPAVGRAQDVPLAELLPDLIGDTIRLNPPPAGFLSHEAHFLPGAEQLQAPNQFNQSIVSLLSTFPLGSSSGGFTYVFDPAVGSFSRGSQSFGPVFAERALTIGRQRLGIGMNYQHAGYDTFEGKDLRDGEIKFFVRHIDCCSATDPTTGDSSNLSPAFEGDIIEAALSLDLKADTVAVFLNYGITDRLDLGAAIPIVHVSMDASVRATIQRISTAGTNIHTFPGDDPNSGVFTSAGSATGIGDIVLRGKYNFLKIEGGGLAAALDLRLPTGDEEELLGSGAAQAKVFLIASTERGMFSPHANIGYTFSGEGSAGLRQFDEFNYVGGLELAPARRLTIAADLLGRTIRDAGRLRDTQETFQFVQLGQTNVQTTTRTQLGLQEGNLNLVLGSTGVKYNPTGSLVISFNLLFPLTDTGLRDRVTPTIGFDYSF